MKTALQTDMHAKVTDGYSVGKRHGNSDGISVGDWGTTVNFVNDTTILTDKFSL